MTDSTSTRLQGKVWVDYDPSRSGLFDHRIIVSNLWAFLLVSLLSVWISLWAPQYWKIIKACLLKPTVHLLLKFFRTSGIRARVTKPLQDNVKSFRDGLLDEVYKERTAEDAVVAILHLLKGRQNIIIIATAFSSFAVFCSTVFFSAAIFLGIAIAATMVSFNTLDNTAPATSPLCGVWTPNANVSVVSPMGQIMLEVESNYQECYENEAQPACNLFPYTELFVNFTDNVECPFVGDICLGGKENSAISLDTGYLNSIYLGLNSPNRPLYRRKTTCAPLTTANHYNITTDTTTGFPVIKFYYGSQPNNTDPSTYNITRDLAFEQIFTPTGYDVKTESSCLGQFNPIAELASANSEPKEYTFLMSVNTYNVHYSAISNDPIFPATTETLCPQSTEEICLNNTMLPSSVLGYTERAEVCYPDLDHCFDVWAPDALSDVLSAPWAGAEETYLVMLGLNYSDFGDLLSTRHALLLNATQQIIGNKLSLALDPDQWKLEVKRLFSMGLLRAKMEMLAVAQGIRANYAGYYNVLPEENKGLCRKVKVQVKRYTNISFVGFMLAIILPLILGLEIGGAPLLIWAGNGVWWIFQLVKQLRLMGCFSLRKPPSVGSFIPLLLWIVRSNAIPHLIPNRRRQADGVFVSA